METEIAIATHSEHDGNGNSGEHEKLSFGDFESYFSALTDSGVDDANALRITQNAIHLYYPGRLRMTRIKLMVGNDANPERIKHAEHTLDQCIEHAVRGANETHGNRMKTRLDIPHPAIPQGLRFPGDPDIFSDVDR